MIVEWQSSETTKVKENQNTNTKSVAARSSACHLEDVFVPQDTVSTAHKVLVLPVKKNCFFNPMNEK